MSTQNTSASIDLSRQLLYYTIRLQNTDDNLHAWMRHILAYLTSATDELQPARLEPQEPHINQGEGCDGSCDCQTNTWVRELSYEQHCRKLLMSRVNVGDTNVGASVDEDSLRREASLVMESVNRSESAADSAETPMDIDDGLESEASSSASSEWDFLMYDSDSELDSMDERSYKPCGSDLLKLDSDYSSDFDEFSSNSEEELNDDEETLSNYTYNVRISTSLQLNAAGNTEQRTVKILRQCGASGNKTRAYRRRAARSATSTDYFYSGDSDDEGDELCAQWERPSST
ncbi:hypothetical protein V9T40_014627 [Parthenolecanium corni]|uniref:Uncharacterized protein n=1 Tax=Parthenolecanium corni TaxID=536013 RepID=A0AAN9T773_9HEMI